jgi:hypothetical protein
MTDYELLTLTEEAEKAALIAADSSVSRINPDCLFDSSNVAVSCERLYVYSLRTQKKLPQHLHEMMLLWSFSDEGGYVCKLYLEWVKRCDEFEDMRRKREKFERASERTMLLIMAVGIIMFMRIVSGSFFPL